MAITADNWNVDADGDWSNASNWSNGKLPTSNNSVTISTTDVHTVTHSGGNDVIDKLTVGQDHFQLSGGALEILTTASFADGYTQTGGTLNAGSVSIAGPAVLTGGASEGSTTFTVTGTAALANYTLGGSSVLKVSATVNQTGQITLGDNTGVNASISGASGGAYTIAGDYGIFQGAATASLVNAGTLAKSAGSGISAINVSVTSTGTISAASGDLQFDGPTNSISGTLSGAGQISFGAGVTSLGKVSITAASFGISGDATVNLGASISYLHNFTDISYGADLFNIGARTFSLTSANAIINGQFGSATVAGSGAFDNKGALTLSSVIFGGTLAVTNSGTILQTGAVTAGDGGGMAPTLTNTATGVYDFTNDSSIGQNGAAATFTNQGLLEKTGVGGTSSMSLAVVNSGTISAQSGTLRFDHALTNTGTLSGSAAIDIDSGSVATFSAGTVLSVKTLELSGSGTLNLGLSLHYTGVFDDTSYGTDDLNLGSSTLTLSGASNTVAGSFGNAVIGGSGTLANTGTLTFGNAVVDGTATIDNTGTITDIATVTIGGGGGLVASVVNASSGKYNVTGAFGIGDGTATGSHFDNSGTFTVTAGSGSAVITTNFNNLSGGVVNISTGALQNSGTLVNAGTISGTRLVLTDSSHTSFSSGAQLTVGELDIYASATLTLGASLSYSGTFVDGAYGSDTLNLGASTLTLRGSSEFSSIGTDIVTGSGTLKIAHASLLDGSMVQIAGTATLEVGSSVQVTGSLLIGDNSANAASAVIDSNGTYDLKADVGVSRGQSAASVLTNNGLFEKTSGSGTSLVNIGFVNNGTITVTSGTVEFAAGTLTNNGTINGTVTTDASGDIFVKAAGAGSGAKRSGTATGSTGGQASLLAQAAAGFGAEISGASPRFDLAPGRFTPLLATHALAHTA